MKEAKEIGLKHGGTGKKLRPLTSCKGTICLHGNIDTQGLCNRLSDKVFGEATPHKTKIGISGCANNCAKANLNDIGIIIGGRFGRAYRFGTDLGRVFKEEDLFDVVEDILTYYRENGQPMERISYVMDRVGEEKVVKDILNIL